MSAVPLSGRALRFNLFSPVKLLEEKKGFPLQSLTESLQKPNTNNCSLHIKALIFSGPQFFVFGQAL